MLTERRKTGISQREPHLLKAVYLSVFIRYHSRVLTVQKVSRLSTVKAFEWAVFLSIRVEPWSISASSCFWIKLFFFSAKQQ